mgnify:CR=1 FL=1
MVIWERTFGSVECSEGVLMFDVLGMMVKLGCDEGVGD